MPSLRIRASIGDREGATRPEEVRSAVRAAMGRVISGDNLGQRPEAANHLRTGAPRSANAMPTKVDDADLEIPEFDWSRAVVEAGRSPRTLVLDWVGADGRGHKLSAGPHLLSFARVNNGGRVEPRSS